MSRTSRDTELARTAGMVLIDGRDANNKEDCASIMVTLDHLIATVILTVMDRDPKKALIMFTEGTVPHVEQRVALYASKQREK